MSEKLLPQDVFHVSLPRPLSMMEIGSLMDLYAPVIGRAACSLYLYLMQETLSKEETTLHEEALDVLLISPRDFLEARKKLEGIGLLRTFTEEKTKKFPHNCYRYLLQIPLAPYRFLSEELLSALLSTKITGARFNKILERYLPAPHIPAGKEVTTKFLDEYAFDPEILQKQSLYVDKSRAAQEAQVLESPVDWELFQKEMDRFNIKPSPLDTATKQRLLWLAKQYQLSTFQLRDLALEVVKLDQGQSLLDAAKMEHLLTKKTLESASRPEEEPVKRISKAERKQALKYKGFSDGAIQIILEAESFSATDYLRALKEAKGGMVTPGELSMVQNISRNGILPDGVLNILMHYLLVESGRSTLNSSLFHTIADDWKQRGIHSAETALARVLSFSQPEQKEKPKRSKKRVPQAAQKEKVPQWMQKKEYQPVDEESMQAFNDAMKKLKGKSGEKE